MRKLNPKTIIKLTHSQETTSKIAFSQRFPLRAS